MERLNLLRTHFQFLSLLLIVSSALNSISSIAPRFKLCLFMIFRTSGLDLIALKEICSRISKQEEEGIRKLNGGGKRRGYNLCLRLDLSGILWERIVGDCIY